LIDDGVTEKYTTCHLVNQENHLPKDIMTAAESGRKPLTGLWISSNLWG